MTVWKFHWFWHQIVFIWFHLYLIRFPSPILKLQREENKIPTTINFTQKEVRESERERLDSVLNINFHFIQIEKWWNISYKLVIIDKDMFPLCSSMTDTHTHQCSFEKQPLCRMMLRRAWREGKLSCHVSTYIEIKFIKFLFFWSYNFNFYVNNSSVCAF